jgi:hypothetical protein
MSIVDILVDPTPTPIQSQKLKFIISAIDTRILTRETLKRSTSSCKFWQLKLNILCLVDIYYFNNEIYYYLINDSIKPLSLPYVVSYDCNKIGNLFSNTTKLENINKDFYDVIYINNPISDVVLPINNINNIDELLLLADPDYYTYGNSQIFSLCIYPKTKGWGSINHFFTLIVKDDKYYINSSYGSDYVCIPQYTTEINSAEFNNFCRVISNLNDNENKQIFVDFFQKFFLKGGLKLREVTNDLDDMTSEERKNIHKFRSIEAGKNAEIEFYFNPAFNNSFEVGLIKNYKSNLINYINSIMKSRPIRGKRTASSTSSNSNSSTRKEQKIGGRKQYKQSKKRITKRKIHITKRKNSITRRKKSRHNRTKRRNHK